MPAKSPETIRQNIEKAIRHNPLFQHLTNEEYWEVSMITARSIARVALQDVAEEARFEKMMEEDKRKVAKWFCHQEDFAVAPMPPLDMRLEEIQPIDSDRICRAARLEPQENEPTQ